MGAQALVTGAPVNVSEEERGRRRRCENGFAADEVNEIARLRSGVQRSFGGRAAITLVKTQPPMVLIVLSAARRCTSITREARSLCSCSGVRYDDRWRARART